MPSPTPKLPCIETSEHSITSVCSVTSEVIKLSIFSENSEPTEGKIKMTI